MSYVTGTAHYNLPQTVGTDKRDWSDTNKAFADVDAALYGATNDLSDVTSRTGVLEGENVTNKQDIAKNASDITSLEGRMTAVEHVANEANNGIADVRNDAEDMITAYNEKSAQSTHDYEIGQFFIYNDVLYKATQKISAGNTIIPNTNCEATNVTTQLNALGTKHIKIPYTYGTTSANELGKSIFNTIRKLEEDHNRIDFTRLKLVAFFDDNETWFVVFNVAQDTGSNQGIGFVAFPESTNVEHFVYDYLFCSAVYDSSFKRYTVSTTGVTAKDTDYRSYYIVI